MLEQDLNDIVFHIDVEPNTQPSMEDDMANSSSFKERLKLDEFAYAVYSAMCNQEWRKFDTKSRWGCSWRTSGGIVADLRDQGEDYIDFYCSGMGIHKGVPEGTVTPEVAQALLELGWRPLTAEEIAEEHQEVLDRIGFLETQEANQDWRGDFQNFTPDIKKTSGRIHALAMAGKISKVEYYKLFDKVDFRAD